MQPTDGRDTILVVDDEAKILEFVAALLTDRGYNVLTAGSGLDALAASRAHTGKISLLLSDFQMPGMSGVELATALTVERPKLRVLLMSGFPEGMLVLNEGWHFLAKPFVASQLCALVSGLVRPEQKSRFAMA